eukprot:COSAG06_NODE_2280_length_7182_cov_10.552167_2_plen_309_part_00
MKTEQELLHRLHGTGPEQEHLFTAPPPVHPVSSSRVLELGPPSSRLGEMGKRRTPPATPDQSTIRTPAKRTKRAGGASHAAASAAAAAAADVDALEYAQRWEKAEAKVMADLRNLAAGPQPKRGSSAETACCAQLRGFICAYGTARTFRGLRADNVAPLAPIVRHIQRRWASGELQRRQSEPAFVVGEVEALADVCKAAGFARNLSFASKTLNMLGLWPVALFSSECVAFLRLPKAVGYGAFHEAWTAEYAKRHEALEAAAAKHAAALSPWPAGGAQGKYKGAGGTADAWLAIRALDIRMLKDGGPMR